MEKITDNKAHLTLEKASTPNLTAAIIRKDKLQVSVILRQYKTDKGAVKFPALLSIPIENRLPEMVMNNLIETLGILNVVLTMAFESMNVKRAMTPGQIVDLAEAIADTCGEDYLALEDLMLFLQKLVRGEYGVMYESMDIPKFMEAFEQYRQERYVALQDFRNNTHLEHKGMGDANRSNVKDELEEHFASMADRLSEMKSQLREARQENRELKSGG